MTEIDTTKLVQIIKQSEDVSVTLPVCIQDGEHIRSIGRISITEIVDNDECAVKSLVFRAILDGVNADNRNEE